MVRYEITIHRPARAPKTIVRRRIDSARYQLHAAIYAAADAQALRDTKRAHDLLQSCYRFAFWPMAEGSMQLGEWRIDYGAYEEQR